jgi:hypothetical protein
MIKTASAVFGDDVKEGDNGEDPANFQLMQAHQLSFTHL